jgi:hypothetical protein
MMEFIARGVLLQAVAPDVVEQRQQSVRQFWPVSFSGSPSRMHRARKPDGAAETTPRSLMLVAPPSTLRESDSETDAVWITGVGASGRVFALGCTSAG